MIVFVSLGCVWGLAPKTTQGCAGPFYQDYVSFFEFSLANDPLFYNYHYYEISPPIGPLEVKSTAPNEYQENLREWGRFFGNQVPEADLEKVIYDSNNKNILRDLLKALKDGVSVAASQWGDLASNQLLKYLIREKLTGPLEYIIYAKDCEPWVAKWDPWLEAPERDVAEMERLINLGVERYNQVTSDFLKLRYAYQVVRLAHYSGQLEKCIEYYDRLVPNLSNNSIITYWAMGHKAGALRTIGKPVESLLLFAMIFDQCPDRMELAFRDFYIPDDELWAECLRSLNNNHRKATMWMLRGLKEKRLTLEPLTNLLQLEPGSSRVEMMLIREVNKAEREYLTSAVFFPARPTGGAPNYRYLKEFQSLVLNGANSGKVRRPGLWYLAAGYLGLIMGDFNQAAVYLTKAETIKSNDAAFQQQLSLIKNLLQIAITKVMTPRMEDISFSNLTWAGKLDHDYNNQAIYRSLLLLLGQKYLVSGETAKAAGCFYLAGYEYEYAADFVVDIYSSNADLDQALLLIQKKSPDQLERLLIKSFKYSVADLRYLKATKLMRQEKFKEALAVFKEIPDSYWKPYRSPKMAVAEEFWFNDPAEYTRGVWTNFDTAVFDVTKRYRWRDAAQSKQVRFYTRPEFAAKVVALQEQAVARPKEAGRYYLQIANGFFHTPFWGYNDPVWQGNMISRLSSIPGYPFNVMDLPEKYNARLKEFLKEYGTRGVALKYYQKALADLGSKDRELAAQCTVMAQLCQTGFLSSGRNVEEDPKVSYFEKLRQSFSGTKVYRDLVKECSLFKDFLAR
jgi:hypothetical protein